MMRTRFFSTLLFSSILLAPLSSGVIACLITDDEPVPTPEPTELHSDSPSVRPDPPIANAGDSGVDAGLCSAIAGWCSSPYVWPLSSAPYDTSIWGPQKCYCECTKHSDCASSPQASECGTYLVAQAGGQLSQFFPGGLPSVCRTGMTTPITSP